MYIAEQALLAFLPVVEVVDQEQELRQITRLVKTAIQGMHMGATAALVSVGMHSLPVVVLAGQVV